MTTVVSSAPSVKRAAGTFHPSFFLWMTVVMTLFIFSGFALTYWIPMAGRSLAPLPPVVHLHGAFFFSWMVLLVVQAVLVSTSNVRTHMSLGTFGISLGTGVFLMGALITVISQGLSNLDPSPIGYALVYLSVTAVLSFGATYLTLDALAIAMLVNDWRTNGRITAASVTGAAFVFVPQLLHPLLVDSAAFASVAFAIGEMSGYR